MEVMVSAFEVLYCEVKLSYCLSGARLVQGL